MLRSTWDLPGPGMEPVSPALAGGFSTTGPPGKSQGRRVLHAEAQPVQRHRGRASMEMLGSICEFCPDREQKSRRGVQRDEGRQLELRDVPSPPPFLLSASVPSAHDTKSCWCELKCQQDCPAPLPLWPKGSTLVALPGVRYGCDLEPVPIAGSDQQKQCHSSSQNWINPR